MADGQKVAKSTQPKSALRKKGLLRVESILTAGATIFVDKGFDAATMTEIAELAGASIGSVYQFFPTKDSIADVLRARYGDDICARWDALRLSNQGWTGEDLAQCVFRITAETLKDNPSFSPLMVVRNRPGSNVAKVRRRYADALIRLLQSRMPALSAAELRAAMMVVHQIVRSEVDLGMDANSKLARSDMQGILATYLKLKMNQPSG